MTGYTNNPSSIPKTRILILKLGALGDVVRTSYILPGLHERFGTGTHVTWITSLAALPLLRFNPYVSELISMDRSIASASLEALNAVPFEWLLSFDDELESCGIASQVSAKRISGAFAASGKVCYTQDTREWFDMGLISRFGKARADQLKIENTHSHDAIFKRMLGIDVTKPLFFNDPQCNAVACTMLTSLPRKLVGLNLSAGRRWPSKSLRLDEAILLIDQLKGGGATCVLLGGKEDAIYLEAIASKREIHVIRDLSLGQFAGVIRGLDLLVTSDTLALHLAIAQGVPTVSYYAPTSAAEINTFGTGAKVASLSTDYCSYRPDADNSTITAERLLPEVWRLLARG